MDREGMTRRMNAALKAAGWEAMPNSTGSDIIAQTAADLVEEWKGHTMHWRKQAANAEAQVARLRAILEKATAHHRGHGCDCDWCLALTDPQVAEEWRALTEAIWPFRSGGDWGTWKAYMVHGPETKERGIAAVRQITAWQVALDAAVLKDWHTRDEMCSTHPCSACAAIFAVEKARQGLADPREAELERRALWLASKDEEWRALSALYAEARWASDNGGNFRGNGRLREALAAVEQARQ